MKPIRLVIADDHAVVLRGLAAIFCREQHIQVVAACRDGAEAYNAIKTLAPDIALLNLSMPFITGLEILAAAQSEKLTTRIILLSARFDDQALRAAMAGGAHGIVLKDAGADEYLHCLADVSRGAKWISAALLNRIAAAAQKSHANPNIGLGKLTLREHEIMKLLRYGHTNKAIAHRMRISEGTVKVHLHNIYRKSAIPNRTALAAVEAAGDDFQSDAD